MEEITSNMAASRLKDTMVKDRKTIKANTNSREDGICLLLQNIFDYSDIFDTIE